MTDKTCGTCLCGQRPNVWCSCADQTKPARQPACDDYAERTDSVDRVARDRYRSKSLKAVCDLLHPICQKSCASYEVDGDEWCVGVLTEVDGE